VIADGVVVFQAERREDDSIADWKRQPHVVSRLLLEHRHRHMTKYSRYHTCQSNRSEGIATDSSQSHIHKTVERPSKPKYSQLTV